MTCGRLYFLFIYVFIYFYRLSSKTIALFRLPLALVSNVQLLTLYLSRVPMRTTALTKIQNARRAIWEPALEIISANANRCWQFLLAGRFDESWRSQTCHCHPKERLGTSVAPLNEHLFSSLGGRGCGGEDPLNMVITNAVVFLEQKDCDLKHTLVCTPNMTTFTAFQNNRGL